MLASDVLSLARSGGTRQPYVDTIDMGEGTRNSEKYKSHERSRDPARGGPIIPPQRPPYHYTEGDPHSPVSVYVSWSTSLASLFHVEHALRLGFRFQFGSSAQVRQLEAETQQQVET